MVAVFLLTFGGMVILMVAMAVGVIFGDRCLRGSCGGSDVSDPAGESLTCHTCPRRKPQSLS